MAEKLFERAILFTDVHFGLRSNSKVHNEDCLDFIRFVVQQGKAKNAETCIFLGDWTHTRSSVNAITMKYSIRAFEILNNAFKHSYIIVGNHDMPYRESREITTNEFSDLFPNITLVREPMFKGGCALVPFLLEQEHIDIGKKSGDHLFGHLELPTFTLTRGIEMPDHGGLKLDGLKGFKAVWTGHFHKRQNQRNTWYIGNTFPHDFGDSYDEGNRGAVYLEYNGDYQFLNFKDSPRYRHTEISDFLDNLPIQVGPKMYVKLQNDLDLPIEDTAFIRDVLMECFDIRELTFSPYKREDIEEFDDTLEFETVDDVVVNQLTSVQSNVLDTAVLVQLYRNL